MPCLRNVAADLSPVGVPLAEGPPPANPAGSAGSARPGEPPHRASATAARYFPHERVVRRLSSRCSFADSWADDESDRRTVADGCCDYPWRAGLPALGSVCSTQSLVLAASYSLLAAVPVLLLWSCGYSTGLLAFGKPLVLLVSY